MSQKDVRPYLEELAKEYDFQETPEFILRIQELITEISRWINDLLKHLRIPVPGDTNTSGIADILQFALIITGALCLVIVAILSIRKLNKIKQKAKLEFKVAEAIEEELDSKGWRLRAEQLASDSHWSKACRALYLSLLYMLDENEILSYTPTRSNYEYWYALSSYKQLQAPFRELVNLVDLIWFGDYQASRSDYSTCERLLNEIAETSSSFPRKTSSQV